MIQILGEACSQGKAVSVDFELGTLICKDREPRFAFAAELYVAEGLQVPSGAAEALEYKPSVSFAPPTKDALSLSLVGSQVGAASRDARGPHSGASLGAPSQCSSQCPPHSSEGTDLDGGRDGNDTQGPDGTWSYCSKQGADVLSLQPDRSGIVSSCAPSNCVPSNLTVASERGSATYGSMRGGGALPRM